MLVTLFNAYALCLSTFSVVQHSHSLLSGCNKITYVLPLLFIHHCSRWMLWMHTCTYSFQSGGRAQQPTGRFVVADLAVNTLRSSTVYQYIGTYLYILYVRHVFDGLECRNVPHVLFIYYRIIQSEQNALCMHSNQILYKKIFLTFCASVLHEFLRIHVSVLF